MARLAPLEDSEILRLAHDRRGWLCRTVCGAAAAAAAGAALLQHERREKTACFRTAAWSQQVAHSTQGTRTQDSLAPYLRQPAARLAPSAGLAPGCHREGKEDNNSSFFSSSSPLLACRSTSLGSLASRLLYGSAQLLLQNSPANFANRHSGRRICPCSRQNILPCWLRETMAAC